jgi:hypothetical protein
MIDISNDRGQDIVRLGAGTNGDGRITTRRSDGKQLVLLGSDPESGGGAIGVFDPRDRMTPDQVVPMTR